MYLTRPVNADRSDAGGQYVRRVPALWRTLVAVGTACVLAGCSGSVVLDRASVPESDVALGDAVLAMYLSPQSYSFANGYDTGYVVLVDADGTVRTLVTGGMDTGLLHWSEDGLFFADPERDYLLTADGLTTTASPKTNAQVSLHRVGTRHVAVYNDGFTEQGGYRTELVVHEGGRSELAPHEGMPWTVARCGDQLVGIQEATGPLEREYPPDGDGIRPRLLVRLWPGTPDVLARVPATHDEPLDGAPDAPCLDGVVHVLTYRPYGEPDADGVRARRHVVLAWDTVSGDLDHHELVDEAGEPLALDGDATSFAQYGADSLVDGELRWFGPDGVVRGTDLATGRTRELVATTSRVDDTNSAVAVLSERDAFVLDVPDDDLAQDMVLTRYPLDGDEPAEVLRVAGVNAERTVHLVLRGIAIAPHVRGGP